MIKHHKTGTDALLLNEFVRLSSRDEVLDIGCGEGYIMSRQLHCRLFLSVDVNPAYLSLWKKRLPLPSHYYFMIADGRVLPRILRKKFSVIVCNPPYYRIGEGRLSPYYSRALARHEVSLKLEDVFRISASLLQKDSRLYLIHIPSRLQEILVTAEKHGFYVDEIHPVKTGPDKSDYVDLVLLSFRNKPSHTGIYCTFHVSNDNNECFF